MGGYASPFIADLYLSWCEYCYVTKIVKTDYAMAQLLSHDCSYLDDICTADSNYFGGNAKDNFLDIHDDVIKWKHFPRYWPFVLGIPRSRWIPRTKASDVELWCFLSSAPE